MRRVIVIGCPGSGKTTFAEKLSRAAGLPLHHLDAIWHRPDRTHISRDAFDRRLSQICSTPQWIIDGNYQRTLEMRLRQCDSVFLFDLPTEVCLQGAAERIGKERCDLPWTETQLSEDFIKVIEAFSGDSLPKIYALLETYGKDKQVVVFRHRSEADAFLQMVECR